MNKVLRTVGIISLALIIGFSMVSCKEDGDTSENNNNNNNPSATYTRYEGTVSNSTCITRFGVYPSATGDILTANNNFSKADMLSTCNNYYSGDKTTGVSLANIQTAIDGFPSAIKTIILNKLTTDGFVVFITNNGTATFDVYAAFKE